MLKLKTHSGFHDLFLKYIYLLKLTRHIKLEVEWNGGLLNVHIDRSPVIQLKLYRNILVYTNN
jgi:hypothetical protein